MKRFLIVVTFVVVQAVLLTGPTGVVAAAPDPLLVMKTSLEAVNAGNVEAAVATFSDDATFANATGSYRGTEQIRRAITADVANHIRIDASNFQVAGTIVTYSFKMSNDDLRQHGIDVVDGTSEGNIQGGKITSLSAALSPDSQARVRAALAAGGIQPQSLPNTGDSALPLEGWLLGSLCLLGLGFVLRRRSRYCRAIFW